MSINPLNFLPGVQRDGTQLDSDRALDALWCRWRLGRPRKMLGFDRAYAGLLGVPRRVHMYYQGKNTIIHIGTGKSIQQVVLDRNGIVVSVVDRTPGTFASGPNAGWTIDSLFDTTSQAVQIIAHSVPDVSVIASGTPSVPFIGIITDTDQLKPLTNPHPSDGEYDAPLVAGGIACAQPYLFDFSTDGFVGWSAPNLPNTLGVSGGTSGAGKARVSAQKIVAGMVQRGGGVNSPAALFFSLSEVITAQFNNDPATIFSFNTVSPSSSILSGATVIEYDGLYIWAGVDRFLMYNGTVVEIPNAQNQDWFFDNMNWEFAGKAFAFKVPRFGEIWFCAPLFGNTEPSHAAIWNIRENCWYDTELPNGGRGAGYFAQGFRYPVMGGATPNTNGLYSLWVHEKGVDQTGPDERPKPVRSYFNIPFVGSVKATPPTEEGVSFGTLEPDIIQSGDMTIYPFGTYNARGGKAIAKNNTVTLKAIPVKPEDQIVSFKTDFRLASLHFESDVIGGNYITGKSLLHMVPGAKRMTGGVGVPLTYPAWLATDKLEGIVDDTGDDVTEG